MFTVLKSSDESAFSAKSLDRAGSSGVDDEGWGNATNCSSNGMELTLLDTGSISCSPELDDMRTCVTPGDGSNPDPEMEAETSDARILFVAEIARETTSDDLSDLFSRCGEVVKVRIKYAKITRHPLGYGFVEMATFNDARLCIRDLNGVELLGKVIHVSWASRNRKLFISSIPRRLTLSDIAALCGRFGTIVDSTSQMGIAESGTKYAVIEFERRKDAEKARDNLNGKVVDGCALTVNWDQSMSARLMKTPSPVTAATGDIAAAANSLMSPNKARGIVYSDFPYFSVHISFRCYNADMVVTEKMIYRAYRLFGSMTTVTIKSRFSDPTTGTTSGFGFIHFETVEGARCAVKYGHSLDVDGVHYFCEFSKHMIRRGEALAPPRIAAQNTRVGAISDPSTDPAPASNSSCRATSVVHQHQAGALVGAGVGIPTRTTHPSNHTVQQQFLSLSESPSYGLPESPMTVGVSPHYVYGVNYPPAYLPYAGSPAADCQYPQVTPLQYAYHHQEHQQQFLVMPFHQTQQVYQHGGCMYFHTQPPYPPTYHPAHVHSGQTQSPLVQPPGQSYSDTLRRCDASPCAAVGNGAGPGSVAILRMGDVQHNIQHQYSAFSSGPPQGGRPVHGNMPPHQKYQEQRVSHKAKHKSTMKNRMLHEKQLQQEQVEEEGGGMSFGQGGVPLAEMTTLGNCSDKLSYFCARWDRVSQF